ncbi:MAG: DUF4359 domain-containing protein [Bacteroidetes bacterium]|nr:DUF4359 domain-containing protein [Bacteroidota bacterium]
MKTTLVVILLLAIVGFATNPDLAKHQNAAKEAFKEKMDSELDENGMKGLKGLANMATELLSPSILNALVSRENYFILSLTKVETAEGLKTAGIGIFGQVIIFSSLEEDFKKMEIDGL